MVLRGITARFPYGVFRGHEPDGSTSRIPSPARLYSALVHAAGTGSLAEDRGGDLRVSEASARALQWLEANPPDALSVPSTFALAQPGVGIFRAEGTFEKQQDRKTLRRHDGVSLAGPLHWLWQSEIPSEIASLLDDLCADVACLGEADSPVVLEWGEAEPTHFIDEHATDLSLGGLRVEAPSPGRLHELEADYEVMNPHGKKNVDQPPLNATVTTRHPSRQRLRRLTYREPVEGSSDTPWPSGIFLPITSGRIPGLPFRVAACVTLHRALAALMPDDAPAVVTGNYVDGAERPANRVSIQLIDAETVSLTTLPGPGFVIMLPTDLTAEEEAILLSAINNVRRVKGSRVDVRVGPGEVVDGRAFWDPSLTATGAHRIWLSEYALIPESRSRDPRGGGHWTFEDAALLSVGFVLRDRLDESALTTERPHRDIVDQVRSWGVSVLSVQQVPAAQSRHFVHKAPAGMVVQPYRAILDMGSAIPARAFLALGQSRHLGGGLMVPAALPSQVLKNWSATSAT